MIIELEGGQKLELQDGATPEQIDDAASHFKQQVAKAATTDMSNQEMVAGLDKLFGGTVSQNEQTSPDARMMRGFMDAPNAIGQGILKGVEYISPGITQGADKYLDRQLQANELQYQAARAATGQDGVDWRRLAGGLVSTAPVAAALPSGTLLKSFGSGAASGLLTPVENGGDRYLRDKAIQASIGAGAGGVGYGVGRVLAPKVAPEVQELMDVGVTPTPGQILGGGFKATEDKLTSIPLLGDVIKSGQRRAVQDLNRAAYNEALAPIGQKYTGEVGHDGVKAVRDAIGAFYDKTLPKAVFQADNTFAQEVGKIAQMAKSMPKPQAKQFTSIMRDKFVSRLGPQGNMDGQTLKGVESELSRLAKGYRADPSFDNRQLGDAIDAVLQSFRGALGRSSAPEVAADLKAANLGYANFARVRDAASRVGASDGIFSPSQLQAAVRAGDKSVGKGASATGSALMQDVSKPAVNVLGKNYPDSGTAGRLILDGITAAALTGGAVAGHLNPIGLAAGGAMMLPYTKLGQKATASLLTQRPEASKFVGEAIQNNPVIASQLLQSFYRQQEPQNR